MALLAAMSLVGTVLLSIPAAPVAAAPPYNYGEALQKAIWFYDAQRLGDLPASNRVSWRGDSFLADGQDANLDLTGGFADAGDTIKATFPFAHAMTTLAWGMVEYPTAYTGTSQGQYLLSNLRWGLDYLIKAHPSANRLVAEVGDPNTDHQVWASAEVLTYSRQTWFIDSTCGGSDLAASAAAAFAAGAMVFAASDATYAATLLTHARQLYTFADTVRKKYSDCVPVISSFYNSWSGYNDELVWGAIWLARATTGTESANYLAKAQSYYANLNREGQSAFPTYKWTYDWDDKAIASEVLLAKLTGNAQYITDVNRWADFTTDRVNGFNGEKASYSPGGQVFYGSWGSLRYSTGAAWLAFVAADSGRFDATRTTRLRDFAVKQVNYTLGDNPSNVSYMVGFSPTYIRRPHHRTAHGSWAADFYLPVENRHTLYGALIGGPTAANDTYGPEDRNDFTKAEVALDYNAAYTAALGRMWTQFGGAPLASFPPQETPDMPELQVTALVQQQGANPGDHFMQFQTFIQNRSAWPARALTRASLRYFFTLDSGVTPAQVTVTSAYQTCQNPSGQVPTQWNGNIYYVTVNCTGTLIAPTGQQFWTRENQIRIKFPQAHNFTADWSFQGINATGTGAATPAPRIALYENGVLVGGSEPSTTPVTPPGAPGQPTASSITPSSVVLTWTAATAGTNPIGGYDVYRVGTPDTVVASTTGALTTTVTGLTPSTAYSFYVKARDTSGVSGAASASRAVTTAASTPPTAPGTPVASAVTSSGVTLTWTAATAGSFPIASYEVHRVQGTTDTIVATPTTTTAAITGLAASTTYSFYVKAKDTAGVVGPASPSVSVTTSAGQATSCTVTYTFTNQWATGFGVDISIANTGTTTINGWTLAFTFPGNQTIADKWSATWTQTGANVTATALSWNATIAPGTARSIGFNASFSGTNNKPSAFTLNGQACTVG